MPFSVFQRSAAVVRGVRSYLGAVAERSARVQALRGAMTRGASSNWGWNIANAWATGGWRGGLAATRRYFAGAEVPGQTYLFSDMTPGSYRLRVQRRAAAVGAMMGVAAMTGDDGRRGRRRSRYYY